MCEYNKEVKEPEKTVEQTEQFPATEQSDSTTPEILTSAPLECTTPQYTIELIRLGRKNNPEQVKLLEEFLNAFENSGLEVNGIYEQKDFNAVVKWQEKYADDILTPWGLKKGTGYVYTRSLAKIKSISESHCPRNKAENISPETDILNKKLEEK